MTNPARSLTESSGVIVALLSALLYGLTTPLCKLLLLADVSPLLLAGLLYLGSGLGLAALRAMQDRGWSPTYLSRADALWLGGATLAGCVAAPMLLLYGLTYADASRASLVLNLEVVFTAVLAWLAFREQLGLRSGLGLVALAGGGVLLVWPRVDVAGGESVLPMVGIAGACLCWAIDNNLTRRISRGDARAIAMMKGLAAGLTNTLLALIVGSSLPSELAALGAVALGCLGYGLSLMLFILALRQLGAARTSAYFASAPFIGAAVSIVLYGELGDRRFWLGAMCMALGVWLQVTERHDHQQHYEETAVQVHEQTAPQLQHEETVPQLLEHEEAGAAWEEPGRQGGQG
jgi:drug/metabolite transporter (DMT)-like permease